VINAYKVLVWKPERKSSLRRHRWEVIDRIILKWILKKYVGRVLTGFIWLKIGTSGRLLYGIDPSGSIRGRECLE
jgi:hypothetical protein